MSESQGLSAKADHLFQLAKKVAEVRVGAPLKEELEQRLMAWAQHCAAAEASREAAESPASALRRNAARAIDEHRARNDALLRDVLAMPPRGRAPQGEHGVIDTFAAVIGAAHRRVSGAAPKEAPPEGSGERKIADLGDGLVGLLRFEVDRYVQQTFGPLAQRLHAVVDSVQRQLDEKRTDEKQTDEKTKGRKIQRRRGADGESDAGGDIGSDAAHRHRETKPQKRSAKAATKKRSRKKFTHRLRER